MNFTTIHEYIKKSRIQNNLICDHDQLSHLNIFLALIKYMRTEQWAQILNSKKSSSDLYELLITLIAENSNKELTEFLRNELELIEAIKSFNDDETVEIIEMVNKIKIDNNQLYTVLVEELNNSHFSSDTSQIIATLIQKEPAKNTKLDILCLGFRSLYLDNNDNQLDLVYIDEYRSKEAKLLKLINPQQAVTIYRPRIFNEFVATKLYDYTLICVNDDIGKTKNRYIANSVEPKDQYLHLSALTASDILNAIDTLKPDGKLYLTMRLMYWQTDRLNYLREYLVNHNLISQCIYVKTHRVNPWILIEITKNKSDDLIYMINDKLYSDGSLKYRINDILVAKIADYMNNSYLDGISSQNINREFIINNSYCLDPNICIDLFNTKQKSANHETKTLQDLAIKIFRGPEIYNKDIQAQEISNNHYIISQSAIGDDGLAIDKLTPIPENIYNKYERLYKLEAGDLIILSRATNNRVTMIPKNMPLCIAHSNVIVVRLNKDLANPAFLSFIFNSKYGKALINSIQKGITLKSISIVDLKKLEINLPDLNTQNLIAEKVTTARAKLDDEILAYNQIIAECEEQI